MCIVKFLKATWHSGLCFKPDHAKGFQYYCDADFAGNWNRQFAAADPSTTKSRSDWIMLYACCPIIWDSKLQYQVELSTTESEYISMFMVLHDIIPLMEITKEMREHKFDMYCKVCEDNTRALKVSRLPWLWPHTKHIDVCYYHFREHIREDLIKIFPVDTKDHIADALTKALVQNTFVHHHKHICDQ